MSTATTTNKSLGRPATFIPFGNKGQKFTVSKVMSRLKPNSNGKTMTRVQVTQRVNQMKEAGLIKAVDKQKAEGQGRPAIVYQIIESLPNAATFKRPATKAQVTKANAAKKATPAPKKAKAKKVATVETAK